MHRLATTHSANRRNSLVWNSHRGQCGHVTIAIPDAVFFGGSVLQRYRTSYAVRSAFLTTATHASCHISQ